MSKNRLGLVGGWLLATAIAVGVASQAVGLVADRAVDRAVQVPIAVAGQSSFGPITAPPADPPPTTVAATTTTSARTTATTSTSTPATRTTTSTTIAAPIETIPTPLDSGSFVTTGGQVTAACTGPDTITLLGAVPVAGWSLDVESSGPARVRVDFESGEHEAEIEVVCRNGQLLAETSD
jgi:hypothetical protein